MDLEIFSLCDYAQDMQGKMIIVGTFDTLLVKDMPAVHPACSIAARIRFIDVERGQHHLHMTIVDPNGVNVAPPLEGDLQVQIPQGGSTATVNFAIMINQLRFTVVGSHTISLSIDGKQLKALPLYVHHQAQSRT